MIKFKVCPRCSGDLYLNEDMFGKYLNCLQCGYIKDEQAPAVIETKTRVKPASSRPAVAA